MSRKALSTRRQLRQNLTTATETLRAASNALWDTKFALLPRASNPTSTAPQTLSGLLAEANRFEGELDTLKNMYRSIEIRTADIISVLETEKDKGRGTRPWWLLRWWWDRELEGDVEMHRRQVQRLRERLEEVVFLWNVIEQGMGPGNGRRYEGLMYAIASRYPNPTAGRWS